MGHQARLGEDRFDTASQSTTTEEVTTESPTTEPQTAGSTPEAIREALLDAVPGQEVVIERETYHVAHVQDHYLQKLLELPTVEFNEADSPLVLGAPDEGDVAWAADIPDEKGAPPSEEDRIPYDHIIVGENPVLSELVGGEEGMTVTTDRDCPHCGKTATGFEQDNAEESHGRVTDVPDPLIELRHCGDCNVAFAVNRPADPDTASVTTYGIYSGEDTADIDGLYVRKDTCLMQFMRETDTYKGVWTASEVASFVNGKMNTEGDADRFGFVNVKQGGKRVVWHDDNPYNTEIEFCQIK